MRFLVIFLAVWGFTGWADPCHRDDFESLGRSKDDPESIFGPMRIDPALKAYQDLAPTDQLATFANLTPERQLAVIGGLAFLRLPHRGGMEEFGIIKTIKELSLYKTVPGPVVQEAVYHLMATYTPRPLLRFSYVATSEGKVIEKGMAVPDELDDRGMSAIQSFSDWNRGEAIAAVAEIVSKYPLDERQEAQFVDSLLSRFTAPKLDFKDGHVPMGAMERHLLLNAIYLLLQPDSKLTSTAQHQLARAVRKHAPSFRQPADRQNAKRILELWKNRPGKSSS